jgi:hypothetical protein
MDVILIPNSLSEYGGNSHGRHFPVTAILAIPVSSSLTTSEKTIPLSGECGHGPLIIVADNCDFIRFNCCVSAYKLPFIQLTVGLVDHITVLRSKLEV